MPHAELPLRAHELRLRRRRLPELLDLRERRRLDLRRADALPHGRLDREEAGVRLHPVRGGGVCRELLVHESAVEAIAPGDERGAEEGEAAPPAEDGLEDE